MRKAVGTLALAALLLLAGCGGGVDTGSPETGETPTPSSTESGAATEPATPTQSATPTPSPVDSSRVVSYTALTDEQQSAFRTAIDGEATFVPNSSYINDSAGYVASDNPFRLHDYVRYDGSLYRIQTARGELYAAYGIQASAASPGANDTVVAFETLPADVQDEVRTAITNGVYSAPWGKWHSLPEPLGAGETPYVRYENQTYEMEYIVADTWATTLRVERTD
ncbi:hypothetical protein [Haloarcula salinisoli]|uniref:DUF7979 domain-containing protein n=1 Tax=Haloarcula salinisoli TaxID=2487746 RepID=A0A8J7YIG1_9EURY|nr:hypothetical protein [Halomicroarcula salinisoli]MBX0304113.1 hypothetical protein [Halomicroarcula salinisoli]